MTRLQGKTAIITGAAQGMGEATVRLFIEQGAKVIVADILDDKGERLAAELGDNARFVHLDVSDNENWKHAVDAALELGTLNILVNNAAILIHANILNTTEEQFMNTVKVNQLGTFLGMKSVFPYLKKSGNGSIINISSVDGLQSQNSLIAYSSSKWAVRGMTKTAALEMGKYGIRVNSVHPGGIYTAMHGSDFMSVNDANKFYQQQAIPRVGKACEVANLSLFLASDEASYCSGSEFIADGGWNAGKINSMLPQL